MSIIDTIRRKAISKGADEASRQLPASSIKREASANEKAMVYQQPGNGFMNCVHSKPYFEACSNCRRSKRDGELRLVHFLRKNGIAQQ